MQLNRLPKPFINTVKRIGIPMLFLLLSVSVLAQFNIPEKPKKETSVYDYIGLLSANEKQSLEQDLIRYADSTSTQIVVAIIGSTEGENINYLGANWGEKWGIGQAKEDNGVLILLARNDKRIAINTGLGVEHLLTDAMCKRIIEREIIPYFKRDDYPGGLRNGTHAIYKVLQGEYKGSGKSSKSSGDNFGVIFVIIIAIGFFIILSRGNKGDDNHDGGHFKRSPSIWDAIILSNAGCGGFGGSSGGSFGGGGFSGGFGGGSFGGGGASGGW